MKRCLFLLSGFLILSAVSATAIAADWPQGSGSDGSFATSNPAPLEWSVTREENIRWKVVLPETGQSTPVIAEGKVFFTTLQPVDSDASLGKDLFAWCLNEKTGEVIWKRPIEGIYPLRLSGCFSDSSAPPAVCDGERVVFLNASGGIHCFSIDGELLWQIDTLPVGRSLPFLHEGKVIFTRQIYPPEPNGNFPHKYAEAPPKMWTQLQALDIESGEAVWTTECGINMGCAILPETLPDGKPVAIVGRGGGHGPPEKPDGISLVELKTGKTLWTIPLDGFMATMSYRFHDGAVHFFHAGEHLSVDAATGKELRRVSILDDVPLRKIVSASPLSWKDEIATLSAAKKKRMITQTSNLLVGRFHYFRSYTRPWLGRVDVETGKVEYLELPLQLKRAMGDPIDHFLTYEEPAGKGSRKLEQQVFVENSMKNSRGFVVFGDKRSKGSGWGHVSSPSPSVAGEHLYVPIMNGTVFVLRWDAERLDEKAIVSINDLGPVGEAYTRASLSFANGNAYAHTIRELICIGASSQ